LEKVDKWHPQQPVVKLQVAMYCPHEWHANNHMIGFLENIHMVGKAIYPGAIEDLVSSGNG
jgi:hypothetical protein